MAKEPNQKLKLLYLMKVLLENTDEEHGLTMQELIRALKAHGISSERKSIYSDLEILRHYGLDIIGVQKDRAFYYYVGSRQFELAELKLLVDSVQAAKFITVKKSRQLIEKIGTLASRHEAGQLQRQVYMAERVKTMNENIYYNVDMIHTAIATNVKIRFQYYQWNQKKEMVLRREGSFYEVSPWALSWEGENYYLIALESGEATIKHFRVDKMLHIELLGEDREGRERFQQFDIALYTRKMFGMFAGEEQMVRLECHESIAGVIIDRFGKDVAFRRKDDTYFTVTVKVAVSPQFISWVIALGDRVKVVGPGNVVECMKKEAERLIRQYS